MNGVGLLRDEAGGVRRLFANMTREEKVDLAVRLAYTRLYQEGARGQLAHHFGPTIFELRAIRRAWSDLYV